MVSGFVSAWVHEIAERAITLDIRAVLKFGHLSRIESLTINLTDKVKFLKLLLA